MLVYIWLFFYHVAEKYIHFITTVALGKTLGDWDF